jgi:acetyl esterase/lipase
MNNGILELRIVALLVSLGVAMTMTANAQDLALWPDGTPGTDPTRKIEVNEAGHWKNVGVPTLRVFPAPSSTNSRTAVVICPGGGYGILAAQHEGDDVARWLNGLGVSAFVLHYRLPATVGADYRFPVPLQDSQRAIRLVRSRAAEWGIGTNRIGILGFSAGGHLAALTLTHAAVKPSAQDGLEKPSCRPDFGILVYPVICMSDPKLTHRGSRDNLLGHDPAENLAREVSPELNVTSSTPPVFLAHARDDGGVPPENSVRMSEALQAHGVPCELHLYKDGGHGQGMHKTGADFTRWTLDCADWLRGRGLAGEGVIGKP